MLKDVTAVRKVAIGLALCVALLWATAPIFIQNPNYVLAMTVNSNTTDECNAGAACYEVRFLNRGLWPIAVDIIKIEIYPSLIGPSITVEWQNQAPEGHLMLTPFAEQSYAFSIRIMGGMHPPETIYVIATADVTILYVLHRTVMHTGER